MQWIDERSPTPDDEYPLFCVAHRSIKPITVEITINGEKVIIEVDTGAAVLLRRRSFHGLHCISHPFI